jgi:hypothetical protein
LLEADIPYCLAKIEKLKNENGEGGGLILLMAVRWVLERPWLD